MRSNAKRTGGGDVITVAILINGHPLMARSASNKGESHNGLTAYHVDDGSVVFHKQEDGAVALAMSYAEELGSEPEETGEVRFLN